MMSLFNGADEDLATIIAALRYWQEQGMCEPANRSDELQDIVTDGDKLTSLDEADVDDLVTRLQYGD